MATPKHPGDTTAGHAATDSADLVVNADSFTRLKQIAEGTLAPGNMERLSEYLYAPEEAPEEYAPEGELHYRIRGSAPLGADGRETRRLALEVRGWVMLQDQVTLKPVRYEIKLAAKLVLARSEEEMPPLEAESDDEDYIVADREIDLAQLVEDEVILDLPMLPGGDAAREMSDETGNEPDAAGQAKKPSPFAVLSALKKPNS